MACPQLPPTERRRLGVALVESPPLALHVHWLCVDTCTKTTQRAWVHRRGEYRAGLPSFNLFQMRATYILFTRRSTRPRDRLGLAGLWAERVSCERLRRAGEYKSFIDARFLPCVDPSFFLSSLFFCRPLSFTRQRGSATSSARLGTSRKSLNGDACACWHAACGRTPRSTSPKSAAQPEGRRSSQAAAAGRPPACPRGAASAADDAAADAARYEHPP